MTHDGQDQDNCFGPPAYHLADWRRAVQDLYAALRQIPDPALAHQLWVARRTALIRAHPMSPLEPQDRGAFRGLDVFAYDPGFRFYVDLAETEPSALTFHLGADGDLSVTRVATTIGLHKTLGQELTLYWINGYGGGLFLPFKDATSGEQTYGGGRYLIDAIKGSDLGLTKDGKLILDFNFAYAPSCAMNPTYVCPLSPRENTLPVPVLAGEKTGM